MLADRIPANPHTSGPHQAECSLLYVTWMGCRRVAAAINIHRDVGAAWVVWAGYGRRPKQTHPAAAAAADAGCCDVVSYISTVNVAPLPAATSRNLDRSERKSRNVDR